MRSRPWRGNVRELQNVIEHVAVLAEPDQLIQPNDIPVYDDSGEWPADSAVSSGVMDEAYHAAKDRVVAQFEKEYLTRLVTRAGGNMSKAARLASIDRTTLYRLMDKHAFHATRARGRLSDSGDRRDPARPAASAAGRRQARAPVRVWDPDGPSGGAIAPAALGRAARGGALGPGRVGARRSSMPPAMDEVTAASRASCARPSGSRPAGRTPISPRCRGMPSRAGCSG